MCSTLSFYNVFLSAAFEKTLGHLWPAFLLFGTFKTYHILQGKK